MENTTPPEAWLSQVVIQAVSQAGSQADYQSGIQAGSQVPAGGRVDSQR